MDGDLATLADVKALLGTTGSPLTAALSASATTVAVLSTKDFPAAGTITIDDEVIAYTAKTETTFTTCTRGQLGTQAVAHAIGARVTPYRDDATLQLLISSASAWAKEAMGDPILEETFPRQAYNGTGGPVLVPKRRPIGLVSEVRIDGTPVPRSTAPLVGGYLHDDRAIYLRGGYLFTRGIQNVELTYTAGYAEDAIPRDVSDLIADVVANAIRDRERGGIRSKTLAGESITYFDRYASARGRAVLSERRQVVPA